LFLDCSLIPLMANFIVFDQSHPAVASLVAAMVRARDAVERGRANWKHGHFSREAKAERSRVRAAILAVRYLRDSI
jgi:hypothetical protein